MQLLTQQQGQNLKPGDVVNVYWFSPRKPKGEEPASREWEGRQEWVDVVWKDRVVSCEPHMTPSDGWTVGLEGSSQLYCTSRMELAQKN